MASNSNFPVPAFNFTADVWGSKMEFQEISGLKAEMGFKEVRSGGFNNQIYKIPTVASYGDVTFKKGIISKGKSKSKSFFDVIKSILHINAPHSLISASMSDITVSLYDETQKNKVCTWTLIHPSLLSWEVSTLNAQNNELAFETLVFSCTELKSSLY